mgnify:CR=1 FL=1
MYEYLIQDETGHIVYVADNKYHAKQLADVLQMRTGKPHFVDCMLASTNDLCDYTPLTATQSIPEQRSSPY